MRSARSWAEQTAPCQPNLLGIYIRICQGGSLMLKTARVFKNNRSQAIRLPKEFQFDTAEVYIRKEGENVILSPRPPDWSEYLSTAPTASPGFMEDVDDLPVQERTS